MNTIKDVATRLHWLCSELAAGNEFTREKYAELAIDARYVIDQCGAIEPPAWEKVDRAPGSYGSPDHTSRLPVPGGWIYYIRAGLSEPMAVFVRQERRP